MQLSEEERHAIGVALNEATLLGLEVDPNRRIAAATFKVLTLPPEGPPPADTRVQLLVHPVGRVLGSLREKDSPDVEFASVPFAVSQVLDVVQSFGGLPVYGWEFIDLMTEDATESESLRWEAGVDGLQHSISLFQSSGLRELAVKLWFDELEICSPDGLKIPLKGFCDGGRRWWDALYAGDPRTYGHGIFPGKRSGA